MSSDCREETNVAPKPCPCLSAKSPPQGVARISVRRGNLQRNAMLKEAGSSRVMPSILVERDGHTQLATRVVLDGEVTVVQDDSQTPAVWVETQGRVDAYVGDKKLDTL